MKQIAMALLALAGLLISACSSVYTQQPLGDEPVVLDASWAGTWLADEGAVTTNVVDGGKGLLQVAWLDSKPEGIEMESFTVAVRSRGDLVFANIRDDESEHGYHWLIIERKSSQLVLAWFPDAEVFNAAVAEKKLPGKVLYPDEEDRDDVVLGEMQQEHFDLITDPASGLMDWKSPIVMLRVSE